MIYVNQKQLDQVEYLIEQSARGHHVLFDVEAIRQAFGRNGELIIENAEFLMRSNDLSNPAPSAPEKKPKKSAKKESTGESAEKHIENLILQPTILSKKAYLENLSPQTFERVIRTYFSIVENNIFEDLKYSQ